MRIQFINPFAERLLKYKGNLKGENLTILFQNDLDYETVVLKLVQKGKWKGDINRETNGELFTFSVSIHTVLGTCNKLHYFIVVLHDITKQKALQNQIRLARNVLENTSEGF